MSGVGNRVARLFVVPAAAPLARPVKAVVVPSVAVVGPRRSVQGVATTLALLLGARTRRGAIVAWWPGGDPVLPLGAPRPAMPAARALALRLQGHGIAAVARGRAVDVDLGEERPGATLVQAQSLAEVPMVLALCAPRDGAADATLVAQDAIVVAGSASEEDPLGALALASLEKLGPPVIPCGVADAPLARSLAAAALVPPPGWPRALSPVLEIVP